jgi:hypothetical protein
MKLGRTAGHVFSFREAKRFFETQGVPTEPLIGGGKKTRYRKLTCAEPVIYGNIMSHTSTGIFKDLLPGEIYKKVKKTTKNALQIQNIAL